jgi:hypothetical protein
MAGRYGLAAKQVFLTWGKWRGKNGAGRRFDAPAPRHRPKQGGLE